MPAVQARASGSSAGENSRVHSRAFSSCQHASKSSLRAVVKIDDPNISGDANSIPTEELSTLCLNLKELFELLHS
jgi:hypothetical protein